jgi:2-dehydro-3-deoxygluconokinase
VGLARLGDQARMVTVLPDNAIGQAALAELRRWGVDTGGVRTAPGRMGLYFLTPGAVLRRPRCYTTVLAAPLPRPRPT